MSSLAEKGLHISKNALFTVFLNRAAKLLGKPFAVAVVLREVAAKLDAEDSRKGPIQQVIDMVRTIIRLVAAFLSGAYRQIETGTIVSGLAVLLYVLSPIDLVPDFIPAVGFMDDLALVSWFIGKFRNELIRFQEWEKASAIEITGIAPEPASGKPEEPPVAELGHS